MSHLIWINTLCTLVFKSQYDIAWINILKFCRHKLDFVVCFFDTLCISRIFSSYQCKIVMGDKLCLNHMRKKKWRYHVYLMLSTLPSYIQPLKRQKSIWQNSHLQNFRNCFNVISTAFMFCPMLKYKDALYFHNIAPVLTLLRALRPIETP